MDSTVDSIGTEQDLITPRIKQYARRVMELNADRSHNEFFDTATPKLILWVRDESVAQTWSVKYRTNGTCWRRETETTRRKWMCCWLHGTSELVTHGTR